MHEQNAMPITSSHLRAGLVALSIAATLTGCVTTNPGPAARDLPPVPDELMKPVAKPKLYKGQDARAALRLTGSALDQANERLKASGEWYQGVRRDFAEP